MGNLHADSFKNDPRVKQAKALLLEALQDQQKHLTTCQTPDPDKIQEYQKQLDLFASLRGGKLWYPYIGSGFGKGALVELLDGSVKYDFINGIGAHVGHSLSPLLEACIDASLENTVMQGHLQQNEISLKLCEKLTQLSKMDFCFLTTSGAMACENALKLALQKRFPRQRILAFENCFMGRTLSLAQVSDKPNLREGLPLNLSVDYLPFYDYQDPDNSLKKTLQALDKITHRYPDAHALMSMELVQGEGGFYPGTQPYFRELLQALKQRDIVVLVDEVQSFGRFASLSATQHFGLEDLVDIMMVGKMTQVCATLFKKEFSPKPGLISQTFTGSSSSLHCGLKILEQLENEDFLGPKGKIESFSERFRNGLKDIAKRHPDLVKGPFGVGSMLAFTPYEGKKEEVMPFLTRLFEAGVIAFAAGANPFRARFLLPILGLQEEDIDKCLVIIEACLKQK